MGKEPGVCPSSLIKEFMPYSKLVVSPPLPPFLGLTCCFGLLFCVEGGASPGRTSGLCGGGRDQPCHQVTTADTLVSLPSFLGTKPMFWVPQALSKAVCAVAGTKRPTNHIHSSFWVSGSSLGPEWKWFARAERRRMARDQLCLGLA